MLELYTDRLRIRSLQDHDWENFLALHLDPDINRYVRIPEPVEVIHQKFEQRAKTWSYTSGDWLTLVIESLETDEFIGLTGFHCQHLEEQRAEVGYLLAHASHGKGYATESLQAVIDWACLSLQVHKFVGYCAKDNIASARVMEKCGFQLEGVFRQQFKIGDLWLDECAYGLLADERQR